MDSKYYLKPKEKSEVQFNGEKKFSSSWTVPYITSIEKEFDERFLSLKKQYDDLMDEINVNELIYNSEIKFIPVIGNIYYLYGDNEKYYLSLIAPWEWRKKSIMAVKFNFNGKWEKINNI